MKREWKPGDVAVATRDDGTTSRAIRRHDGTWRVVDACINNPPYYFRPLVVIDPEDHDAVDELASALIAEKRCTKSGLKVCGVEECVGHRLQAALRSLVTPPKPEEPTDLAVRVEAGGAIWARVGDVWIANACHPSTWLALTQMSGFRILSEGVQP